MIMEEESAVDVGSTSYMPRSRATPAISENADAGVGYKSKYPEVDWAQSSVNSQQKKEEGEEEEEGAVDNLDAAYADLLNDGDTSEAAKQSIMALSLNQMLGDSKSPLDLIQSDFPSTPSSLFSNRTFAFDQDADLPDGPAGGASNSSPRPLSTSPRPLELPETSEDGTDKERSDSVDSTTNAFQQLSTAAAKASGAVAGSAAAASTSPSGMPNLTPNPNADATKVKTGAALASSTSSTPGSTPTQATSNTYSSLLGNSPSTISNTGLNPLTPSVASNTVAGGMNATAMAFSRPGATNMGMGGNMQPQPGMGMGMGIVMQANGMQAMAPQMATGHVDANGQPQVAMIPPGAVQQGPNGQYFVQQPVYLDQNGQPIYYRPDGSNVQGQYPEQFMYAQNAQTMAMMTPNGGQPGDPNMVQNAQYATMNPYGNPQMVSATGQPMNPNMPQAAYWQGQVDQNGNMTNGANGQMPMYMNGPGGQGGPQDQNRPRMVFNPVTGQYINQPMNNMAGPNGQMARGPNGQQMGPNGQPLMQNGYQGQMQGTMVGPDGQPMNGGVQGQVGPNGMMANGMMAPNGMSNGGQVPYLMNNGQQMMGQPNGMNGMQNMGPPALLPRSQMGMHHNGMGGGGMGNNGMGDMDYRRDKDHYGNRNNNRHDRNDRNDRNDRDHRGNRNGNGGNSHNSGINPVRDPLVEEFRSTYGKSRQWGLRDLLGHVVAFCQDQHGSRFIQQRLEVCSDVDKQLIFEEIMPAAQSLMTDVFGNYVLQKLFEYGSPDQCETLAQLLKGQSVQLAMQMYGCRVVQKALEYVSTPRLIELVQEFENPPLLLRCVHDSNGNHVIQKCIEIVSKAAKDAPNAEMSEYLSSRIQFIITAFQGRVKELSSHPYGCRVVQRILEHSSNQHKAVVLEELRQCCTDLVQDCYGNYVIQFVMVHGWEQDRAVLIHEVQANLLDFSQHKFASNVVEKCLQYANKKDRDEMIWTIINVTFDLKNPVDAKGHCVLESMVRDPYANYVVQKVIDVSDERQRAAIMRYVKENITQLRRYTYGKHIIVRLEKITNEKF